MASRTTQVVNESDCRQEQKTTAPEIDRSTTNGKEPQTSFRGKNSTMKTFGYWLVSLVLMTGNVACGSDSNDSASGAGMGGSGSHAASGSGGTSGSEGTTATGGSAGSTENGGTAGVGGTSASGGSAGTSGAYASGGSAGTSGTSASGGSAGTSGTSASGGSAGTGGASATSGSAGSSGTGTSGSSGANGECAETDGSPPNLLIDYGFEDWTGLAETTPGYIFSTSYAEYWDRHTSGTEVVSNCGANMPHCGTHFLHINFFTGDQDACLGTTPTSVATSCNIGANLQYPGGNTTEFANDVASDTLFARFHFRVTGEWKLQPNMGRLKFFRLYGTGGTGDGASAFVHIASGDNTNTGWWIYDPSGPSYSDIWGTSFEAGTDLQDGDWHSVCVRVDRNNDSNQTGNVTTTVWWDDWNMNGPPSGTRTVTVPEFGDRFSHLTLFANWSATYPESDMGIDLDDVQIWDGMPTL